MLSTAMRTAKNVKGGRLLSKILTYNATLEQKLPANKMTSYIHNHNEVHITGVIKSPMRVEREKGKKQH